MAFHQTGKITGRGFSGHCDASPTEQCRTAEKKPCLLKNMFTYQFETALVSYLNIMNGSVAASC